VPSLRAKGSRSSPAVRCAATEAAPAASEHRLRLGVKARISVSEIRFQSPGQCPISDAESSSAALSRTRRQTRPTPFFARSDGTAWPDAFTLVAWAEQATATEYASLAPVALNYAEAGDPFAEEIVAEGAVMSTCSFVHWWNSVAPRISLLGVCIASGSVAFT